MEPLVDIIGVEVIGEYQLRLTFQDGTVGDVDFRERDWRGVFEPLRDPAYFARVAVDPDAGTITWPNGVDMAPEPPTPTRARTSPTCRPPASQQREAEREYESVLAAGLWQLGGGGRTGTRVATLHAGADLTEANLAHDIRIAVEVRCHVAPPGV